MENTTRRMKPRILIIYTGGTIGMMKNAETGALEPFDFNGIREHIPELRLFDYDIDNYQFRPPIDSSDMTPELWVNLADIISTRYDHYDGFVLLHGTDTMAFTASALSFMLEGLTKPVVLTGSQLPIGAMRTDGRENLITAIEIAAARTPDGRPRVPEVSIYFASHLYRGNRTTKENAEKFNAFASYNYPPLARAGININYNDALIHQPVSDEKLSVHRTLDNRVLALTLFPGIRPQLIENVFRMPDIRGIVLRTFGSGNAPSKSWFIDALRSASEAGKVVVNITQCQSGSVEMGLYQTGIRLREAGVVSGRDMTVEAAVAKLMVLFGQGLDADEVRRRMEIAIAGEIS